MHVYGNGKKYKKVMGTEIGYQLCPKCEGTGLKHKAYIPTGTLLDVAVMLPSMNWNKDGNLEIIDRFKLPCPVCNGKMIISVETGKPPIE